jgi:magnesium transporter
MAKTRCYKNGKLISEDFPLDQVSEHLDTPQTIIWIDLAAPTKDELELLADEMKLHVLAVEDALEVSQRPKLDQYGDHLFLSAYQAQIDADTAEVTLREIAGFITERVFVTVHNDKDFDFAPIVARWDAEKDLAKWGVSFLVHGLLDYLVDGYFDAVQSLDEQIEDLEGDIFVTSKDQTTLQQRTFELRKSLVKLRRVILPMREVINTFLRRDLHLLDSEMAPYFQDVYDHVLRATEWTESLRDLVSSILDANLAIQGNRLNVITKKVTGWAAIIAVPTAITGFYGQNVPYPGFGHLSGLITSSAIIIVGSVLLYVGFKKRDWI